MLSWKKFTTETIYYLIPHTIEDGEFGRIAVIDGTKNLWASFSLPIRSWQKSRLSHNLKPDLLAMSFSPLVSGSRWP